MGPWWWYFRSIISSYVKLCSSELAFIPFLHMLNSFGLWLYLVLANKLHVKLFMHWIVFIPKLCMSIFVFWCCTLVLYIVGWMKKKECPSAIQRDGYKQMADIKLNLSCH